MNYTIEKDWTAHGLRCVAIGSHVTGHRCGYVGLPRAHPLYGVGYSDPAPVLAELFERAKRGPIGDRGVIPMMLYALSDNRQPTPDVVFDVHGSITYAGNEPGYPATHDELWWYGFDCGHCDDAVDPELLRGRVVLFMQPVGCVIRDLDFVVAECEKLAAQLATLLIYPPRARRMLLEAPEATEAAQESQDA